MESIMEMKLSSEWILNSWRSSSTSVEFGSNIIMCSLGASGLRTLVWTFFLIDWSFYPSWIRNLVDPPVLPQLTDLDPLSPLSRNNPMMESKGGSKSMKVSFNCTEDGNFIRKRTSNCHHQDCRYPWGNHSKGLADDIMWLTPGLDFYSRLSIIGINGIWTWYRNYGNWIAYIPCQFQSN